MKKKLLDKLACPECKGDLELKNEEIEEDEIQEGELYCKKCDETYEIEDGVPNLLPPDFEE
ncbi:MAG: methytransferase partner Trm112 [Halanaerobium sp.]